MLEKVVDFFRKLFKKKEVVREPTMLEQTKARGRLPYGERRVVRRAGSQAVKQDIGKFMKRGRYASWYRKSIKERKPPEETD